MKRFLVLSLMFISAIASWAYDFEVNGIYYNILSTNTCEVTSGDLQYSGRVDIPNRVSSSGSTYSVTSIGKNAFRNCSDLTNVYIPNTVTSIDAYAFSYCTRLDYISIPNSVTSIGRSAFNNCSLTSVSIPSSVTSIGISAFSDCSRIYYVDIPNSVTSIGQRAFNNCTRLTSVEIPNSLTSLAAGLFSGCTSLTSVTIPNSVTSISNSAFSGCTALEKIVNEAVVPQTITSEAFSGITSLSNIVLTVLNPCIYKYKAADVWKQFNIEALPEKTSGETGTVEWRIDERGNLFVWPADGFSGTMADACPWSANVEDIKTVSFLYGKVYASSCRSIFQECKNMTAIDFNNFDTSNVTDMGYMFYNCQKLASLDVSNIDTRNVTDMAYTFYYCSGLTSLNLSTFDTRKVTDMSHMFEYCSELTSLNLSTFDTHNVTSMQSMFDSCKKLASLNISSFDTQNVTDMAYMFYYCQNLASLDVSKFKTLNVTSMRSMFNSCKNLASLDVSKFDTQNVTDMKYMFYYCQNLASLDVSNFDTRNVTDMKYMFYYCQNLTSLDVSHFDTQNVTDMKYMFYYCQNLASLDVSNFDTRNVTDMKYMFYYCQNLTSLDVSHFDTRKVTDMSHMFGYCSELTSLNLSTFDTHNVTSMQFMFDSCKKLASLNISSFDTRNVTDMAYMFYYCQNLASLDLSNFDTRNVTNMAYMFAFCSSLERLDLTNFCNTGLSSAYWHGFERCSSLTTIISNRIEPSALLVNTFRTTLSNINRCTLFVPNESVDAYKNADGWKDLANGIFGMGDITLVDTTPYTFTRYYYFRTVSYERNFNNTNWQALYIPFSMSYDDWKDDFEVARINAFFYKDGDINKKYLNAIKVTSGRLDPNTPYLIKAREEGEKTIKVDDTTLYAAVPQSIDCYSVDFLYTFTGTYEGVSGEDMERNQYFSVVDGNLLQSSDAITPYRWYVKEESRRGSTSAGSKAPVIYIEIDGEVVDALDTINSEIENQMPGVIYNLQGQRVDEGALVPGVYIKNGKKYLVK